MLAWLSVWSELQTCHSLSLASVKSRLVLRFWYRLTSVVPEKGPLNGCVCVCLFLIPCSCFLMPSKVALALTPLCVVCAVRCVRSTGRTAARQVRVGLREAGRVHNRRGDARESRLHRDGHARARQDTPHDPRQRQMCIRDSTHTHLTALFPGLPR